MLAGVTVQETARDRAVVAESEATSVVEFALPEQSIDEAWRARARVPAESQHGHLNLLPPERQRLVAAPHIEIHDAALHFGTSVHDDVDTVVLRVPCREGDNAADGQDRRV